MTTTRVTNKTVVFSRPFVLNEADGEQPPGIYTVETEEERLDVMSISAYRRVSTVMNHYNQYAGGGFVQSDGRNLAHGSPPFSAVSTACGVGEEPSTAS